MSRRLGARPCAVLVCLGVAGCAIGGGGEGGQLAPLADQPRGIRVAVTVSPEMAALREGLTTGGHLFGEVLAVQDDGLLIWVDLLEGVHPALDDHRLVLFDFDVLQGTLVRIADSFRATDRTVRALSFSNPGDMDLLRTWSRYPDPAPESVVEGLVRAYQVQGVLRIGGPPADGEDPEALAAFLDRARKGAAAFQDRSAAIAAGYRQLGPDFPAMGEHWVHPGRIVERDVVPEEPAVLTYLTLDGTPRLAGVAYAVPLDPGQAPPSTPAGSGVWHDHTGSIDEEMLLLDSPSTHRADGDVPRLAMFHAWLWIANPDGTLAQNNWSLPFVRAGLTVPERPNPAVARALSILGGGEAYYRVLITRAAQAQGADRDLIRGVVARSAEEARTVLGTRTTLDAATAASLSRIWTDLWDELERGLSRDAWHRLEGAAEAWRDGAHAHG